MQGSGESGIATGTGAKRESNGERKSVKSARGEDGKEQRGRMSLTHTYTHNVWQHKGRYRRADKEIDQRNGRGWANMKRRATKSDRTDNWGAWMLWRQSRNVGDGYRKLTVTELGRTVGTNRRLRYVEGSKTAIEIPRSSLDHMEIGERHWHSFQSFAQSHQQHIDFGRRTALGHEGSPAGEEEGDASMLSSVCGPAESRPARVAAGP